MQAQEAARQWTMALMERKKYAKVPVCEGGCVIKGGCHSWKHMGGTRGVNRKVERPDAQKPADIGKKSIEQMYARKSISHPGDLAAGIKLLAVSACDTVTDQKSD